MAYMYIIVMVYNIILYYSHVNAYCNYNHNHTSKLITVIHIDLLLVYVAIVTGPSKAVIGGD